MNGCDSDAIVIKSNDKIKAFEKLLSDAKDNPVIVLFKANWCGHCKTITPKFEYYREKCKRNNSNLFLIIAEISTAKDLFTKYNVEGFPSTFLFKNKQIKKKIVGADVEEIEKLFNSVGL